MNIHSPLVYSPLVYSHVVENDAFQIFDAQITRNRIKIAVIGEKNCGKSALISRFAHDAFDEMKTSSKSCVVFQRPIAGTISKVELVEIDVDSFYIDDSLTEKEQKILRKVDDWTDVDVALLLYDITSTSSLERSRNHLQQISRQSPPSSEIAIVGTKCDLKENRKVAFKDADLLAEQTELSLFEVSAKTGINCSLCLEEVIERTEEKRRCEWEEEALSSASTSLQPSFPSGKSDHPDESSANYIFCWRWWS